MKRIIVMVFLLIPFFYVHAAAMSSSLQCRDLALKDAKKLLVFYRDNDNRVEIDDMVNPLAKIKNPVNKDQFFDVLEVSGTIYKGRYRMRLIYSPENDCLLMGEEILELANL